MSEKNPPPFFNFDPGIGKLAKPVNTLIEKIAAGAGVLYEPTRIRREANAKAHAALTIAKSKIEIHDLEKRTVQRWMEEETLKQQNMESIIGKALPNVTEEAVPNDVSNEWLLHFFDKCRLTSDAQMQDLWAKLLAGEANEPSTFSKRLINILGDLDKSDAELFQTTAGFAWNMFGAYFPLVFDYNDSVYKENGLRISRLKDLQSIGLINMESRIGYVYHLQNDTEIAKYFDNIITLHREKIILNDLPIGLASFTTVGQELMKIVRPKEISGFFKYCLTRWSGYYTMKENKNAPPLKEK